MKTGTGLTEDDFSTLEDRNLVTPFHVFDSNWHKAMNSRCNRCQLRFIYTYPIWGGRINELVP